MKPVTRRSHLRGLGASCLASALFRSRPLLAAAPSQSEATEAERIEIDRIAKQFLNRFSAPGLSMAIAKSGQFVFKAAYGLTGHKEEEALTPEHLFRIASVSKPVTSACIFALIERGKFRLHDLVFGKKGLLAFDYGKRYSAKLEEISVHHLLTHTCGGWGKGSGDPMFQDPALNQKELIEQTLRTQRLRESPGKHFEYSNFGYCLLGRVVEKISGKPYPDAVKELLFDKCGITRMRLGGNTLAERSDREVKYHGQNGEDPYGMNVTRMDSHGGWLGTPEDLVKFALGVDGFENPPDLLSARAMSAMIKGSDANPGYACGWAVNQAHNWWHNGSLPGLSTILVRTHSGLCWAAFTNTRDNKIDGALDQLMWEVVRAVPAWRA